MKKGVLVCIFYVLFMTVSSFVHPLDAQANEHTVSFSPQIAVPGEQLTITYRGKYKKADNLTLRYGYNGWNFIKDQGLSHECDEGNLNFYKEAAMQKHDGGGFFVTIPVPLEARAIHFAFKWDDNGTERWDNNDTKDYRKAIVFPYIGPYLTWNDTAEPHNGVVVNFQTSNPSLASVEYGATEALGQTVTTATTRDLHHFELTGLTPGTTYHYRVKDDLGQNSKIYSFKTGTEGDTEYKFLIMADMQDNGDDRRWGDIAKEISGSHGDAAFMVIAGDMPWDDEPGHWWTFFDKARDLFAGMVMMPVVGNHDTPSVDSNPDTTSFRDYFDLPKSSGIEAYYAFDFGNARFLNLNSEAPREFRPNGGAQYIWAKKEIDDIRLDGAGRYNWVFAQWHIPPYDAAKRHSGQQGQFRDITKLFDGTVDWVFSGHEHLNHRIKPMEYNGRISSHDYDNPGNTGYIIVPPAGNYPANEILPPDDPKARYRDRVAFPDFTASQHTVDSEIGFITVKIDGKSIDMKTYGMGTLWDAVPSHVRDRVAYTKQ